MRSQVLASTRRLLCPSASLRLPATSFATLFRPFSTVRSISSHPSSCRCLSCFSTPSLLPFSRPTSSAARLSSCIPASRHFASDAHAHDAHTEHSHGDFLDRTDVESRVLAVLRNIEKLSGATITAQSTWQELGLDSLDEVEVVMQLEEEFMVDLYDPDAVKITSVPEAVEAFSNFPFAM